MMTRFSDVLRLALEEPGQHEVRLEQELRFLDQYPDLQRMRFGDRLDVELDVGPSTLDCQVPSARGYRRALVDVVDRR
jgi:LytS/YehU family sensor histidine kinase